MKGPKQEHIKFAIAVVPTYFDKMPHLEILINNETVFDQLVSKETQITFERVLEFGKQYELVLKRSNWDVTQVATTDDNVKLEQSLEIKNLSIDGINCEWLCYDHSYTVFDYPEHFVRECANLEIDLPNKKYGSRMLTFNATWIFNFTSPFYQHVMKCMGGGVY